MRHGWFGAERVLPPPAMTPDEDVSRLLETHLTPEARSALGGPPGELVAFAREVAPGVFALPLLTPAHCARLRAELHRRERVARLAGSTLQRPNSMNRDGVMLDEVGFGALLDDLLARVGAPLGRALFAHVGGESLDHRHGFTVEYSPARDRDLSLHIDDAEVTLNLCLGDAFEGGALAVVGHRCLAHADTPLLAGEDAVVEHEVGTVLVHAGALRHHAEGVTDGHRVNLVVWCQSARFRRTNGAPARCGAWCARHSA